MKRNPSRLLVAALALSLLAACSTAKESGGGNSANGSSDKGDPATNGASQIGLDQPDPSKAIYTKQFTFPDRPQRKVTVAILSLERKDQVLMLKVVVTPQFADKAANEVVEFTTALGYESWDPSLLDLKNLKSYGVLSSAGTKLKYEGGVATNGKPIYGWAAFAPPPPGVTSMDISINGVLPRITNVPIR